MNTFSIDLDLDKQGPLQVVRVRQGDKNGTTIAATIYDHGQPLAGSFNTRVVLAAPGGEAYYRKVGTFANGVATVTIDETGAATISGQSFGYFQLLQGTTVIASTESFVLQVLPDALADASVAEPYDEAIQQAIDELQEATEAIPGQVQAEVDAQLAAHPEWTTTVQDGSITYPKLASSLKQRLGNTLHRLVTAPVVTASDAYAAPPVALCVQGKSVQDGTPTPDAPVAIQSVESVSFGAAGWNLFDASILSESYYSVASDGKVTVLANDGSIWTQVAATPLAAGTYAISRSNASGRLMGQLLDASGEALTFVSLEDGVASTTFTAPASTASIRVKVGTGASSYPFTTTVQLEHGSTATPYQPYVGSTTAIPLQGHALRSLPDGTHDELRVDADGAVTLVQRVGSVTLTQEIADSAYSYADLGSVGRAVMWVSTSTAPAAAPAKSNNGLCTAAPWKGSYTENSVHAYVTNSSNASVVAVFAQGSTAVEVASKFVGEQFLYEMATPAEIPLGTVTLPTMPAPDLTAWASCTPATEIELDYARSVTIAVERLEAAIAELATN